MVATSVTWMVVYVDAVITYQAVWCPKPEESLVVLQDRRNGILVKSFLIADPVERKVMNLAPGVCYREDQAGEDYYFLTDVHVFPVE